jgi:cytochrome c5
MKKFYVLAAVLSAAVTATAAPDAAKIEKSYTATCAACHGAGVLGAPKTGDKGAWKPRVAKGKPALYASALNGVKMMPPRGGNPSLKDDEIKALVDYMTAKSN